MTYHGWDGFIQHGLGGDGGGGNRICFVAHKISHSVSVKGKATTNYF